MAKYLFGRILRSLLSVILVVAAVMVLVYTCLDRNSIFASDPVYAKQKSNAQQVYKMQQWEKYGYLDYVSYADFLLELRGSGELDGDAYNAAVKLGDRASEDSAATAGYVKRFTEEYTARGYTVERLNADMQGRTKRYKDGGEPRLYAYRDVPLVRRLWDYLAGIVTVDSIRNATGDVGERGLTFTLHDPAYGGEKFSPAILGNGTTHKYLLYFDSHFPYLHQNFVTIRLGRSYSVNSGVDVFETMTGTQGSFAYSPVTYPTGVTELTADDLHSATYVEGSLDANPLNRKYFVDDYTNVTARKTGLSKIGYSFTIGIIAVGLSYLLAIPLGILMALKKDKLPDKLGTGYIVFIIAVPSLAYIFLFKAIGGSLGLPTTFDMESPTALMYVLPVVSLALPAAANLMKWLRRYMIDQMHADYVKFARAGGLSEGEIFNRHILKNAIIPIVHGIPGSILGAMVGAIITERVYVVPGAGNLLTNAINAYDNGVIVGVALFYAVLTVASSVLGDVLISMTDPRISFTAKKR